MTSPRYTSTNRARHTVRTETADVVVVGARCAGAATAMLLTRAGHDVVVVDRAAFPSDTLSTHAIARGGVVQLDRWGLLDSVLDSRAEPLTRQAAVAMPVLAGAAATAVVARHRSAALAVAAGMSTLWITTILGAVA